MPDKYYLDIEGAKAIMQKSVDFFDKSKNYILISIPTFNPSDGDDAELDNDVGSCAFMHKDTKVGELTNNYIITDPKYTETFKAQNVTGDMFVRFVVDNYRGTGAKMDIVCNYIETRDPSPNENLHIGGTADIEEGSKAAVFEGCGPLGETCRFIYVMRAGVGVYGLLRQVYWADVDPLLRSTLTYSSDSYGIYPDFRLYNMCSGGTDSIANVSPFNYSYYGKLSPYTYVQNAVKSRIQLLVNGSVNTQLTGQDRSTIIELHPTQQDSGQITYASDNIPTATGGHVYLTAIINYRQTDPVDFPWDITLSIGSVQVSRSEPITEAEIQAMFNPTGV